MNTQLSKWGNSLAIRVPKSVAQTAGLREGDLVSLEAKRGAIVARSSRPRYTLARLLKGMKRSQVHAETRWGVPRGKEEW